MSNQEDKVDIQSKQLPQDAPHDPESHKDGVASTTSLQQVPAKPKLKFVRRNQEKPRPLINSPKPKAKKPLKAIAWKEDDPEAEEESLDGHADDRDSDKDYNPDEDVSFDDDFWEDDD